MQIEIRAVFLYTMFILRITEFPKLEGIHKAHQVQLTVLHMTTQKSNDVSESIVQMLLLQ